jgi:hypothetical protein
MDAIPSTLKGRHGECRVRMMEVTRFVGRGFPLFVPNVNGALVRKSVLHPDKY